MSRIRNSPATRPAVALLATAIVVPLVTPVLAQPVAPPAARQILVFPLVDESSAPRAMSDLATRSVARALDDTERYSVEVFSRHAPTARRKVDEGVLGSEDIIPPYEPRAAVSIGRAFAVDEVLLGTVVDRTLNEATNVLSVTVTGRTYVVADNVEPATGAPLPQITVASSFGVTGASRERRVAPRDPDLLDQEACDDAGAKVAEVLAGVKPPEPTEEPKKRKPFLRKWGPLLALLVIAVGVAIAGGDDARAPLPGPRNLVWSITVTDQILLQWDAPGNPPSPVLRYRIDRSLNSAAWERIDGGAVLGGATDFTDTDAPGFPSGSTVEYRIRAEYSGNRVSSFVETGPISIP